MGTHVDGDAGVGEGLGGLVVARGDVLVELVVVAVPEGRDGRETRERQEKAGSHIHTFCHDVSSLSLRNTI